MWTLANILTMARILAVPLVVGLFYIEQPLGSHLAIGLYGIACITDFFDGYLARATGTVSKIGQFLDPIADKLMVAAVLIMLIDARWLVGIHVVAGVIIMCREILVSGLREFLAGLSVSLPVTWLAKWKTTVQMVALGALIWTPGGASLGIPAQSIGVVMLWGAAVITLYTGLDYLKAGIQHMMAED